MDPPNALVLTRELRAGVAQVQAAWTDPERMATWWWPFLADTVVELDPRPGGRYRMESAAAGIGATGRYLVVGPPARLRFTWWWITDGVAAHSSDEVEVGIEATAVGSRVTLTHVLDPRAGDGAALEQGWSETLDVLVRVLGGPPDGADGARETPPP